MFRVKSPVGIFDIDKKGDLAGFTPFSDDEEAVEELIKELNSSGHLDKDLVVFLERQKELVEAAGLDYGDYLESRHRVAIKLAENLLARSLQEEESIIQAIGVLGDLNRALNLLISRFAALCSAYGIKLEINEENIDFTSVLDAGKNISSAQVDGLSTQIESLLGYKDTVESEIEGLMSKTAPNISGLIGPLLGAKLISAAKGLEQLAKMPASRIQVLGAERAMFRHLREKGAPPKHGVIFQHPTISKSPWWQRGKIARSLAAKLAIAARLDAYSDMDRSSELRTGFLKRYKTIKKTYQKEPEKMRIIRAPKDMGKVKKRRKRRR